MAAHRRGLWTGGTWSPSHSPARPGPARPPVPPSSYLARLHHLLECSAAAATGAADDGPLAANVKTQLIMLAEEPASQPARLIISTGSRLV